MPLEIQHADIASIAYCMIMMQVPMPVYQGTIAGGHASMELRRNLVKSVLCSEAPGSLCELPAVVLQAKGKMNSDPGNKHICVFGATCSRRPCVQSCK